MTDDGKTPKDKDEPDEPSKEDKAVDDGTPAKEVESAKEAKGKSAKSGKDDKASKSSTKKSEEAEEAEEEEPAPEDDKPMSFWEHLDELRKRMVRALLALVVGVSIAWNYREELLNAITKPFHDSWIAEGIEGDPSLHFASPQGIFTAYFSLAVLAGAVLAAPVIFLQLWGFVAPGLYAREKRYVIPFVVMSTLLFGGGGYFGYLAAFPITFGYFLSLAGPLDTIVIKPTVMMEDYIDFVTKMFLGFGIIFQVPILFTFLALTGAVTHRKLIRWFRYYVFVAFLVSAILTPPDATSLLAMAIPAVALYGVSIGLVYIFQRKSALEAEIAREKEEEAEKAEKEREEKAAAKATAKAKLARAKR